MGLSHWESGSLGYIERLWTVDLTCLSVLEDVLVTIVSHCHFNRLHFHHDSWWWTKTLVPAFPFWDEEQKVSHWARSGMYGGWAHTRFFSGRTLSNNVGNVSACIVMMKTSTWWMQFRAFSLDVLGEDPQNSLAILPNIHRLRRDFILSNHFKQTFGEHSCAKTHANTPGLDPRSGQFSWLRFFRGFSLSCNTNDRNN